MNYHLKTVSLTASESPLPPRHAGNVDSIPTINPGPTDNIPKITTNRVATVMLATFHQLVHYTFPVTLHRLNSYSSSYHANIVPPIITDTVPTVVSVNLHRLNSYSSSYHVNIVPPIITDAVPTVVLPAFHQINTCSSKCSVGKTPLISTGYWLSFNCSVGKIRRIISDVVPTFRSHDFIKVSTINKQRQDQPLETLGLGNA